MAEMRYFSAHEEASPDARDKYRGVSVNPGAIMSDDI